jgi:hypothetical protein
VSALIFSFENATPRTNNLYFSSPNTQHNLFKVDGARQLWLTPVILAAREAEIRRIEVQSQPGEIVHKTLS